MNQPIRPASLLALSALALATMASFAVLGGCNDSDSSAASSGSGGSSSATSTSTTSSGSTGGASASSSSASGAASSGSGSLGTSVLTCIDTSTCDQARSGFSACGGAIADGAYKAIAFCSVPTTTQGTCAGSEQASAFIGDDADVTIQNGVILVANERVTEALEFVEPSACDALTCTERQQFLATQYDAACCATVGDDCECEVTKSQAKADTSFGYTVSGKGTLAVENDTIEYCVSGDLLLLRTDGGTAKETVQVLQKK